MVLVWQESRQAAEQAAAPVGWEKLTARMQQHLGCIQLGSVEQPWGCSNALKH